MTGLAGSPPTAKGLGKIAAVRAPPSPCNRRRRVRFTCSSSRKPIDLVCGLPEKTIVQDLICEPLLIRGLLRFRAILRRHAFESCSSPQTPRLPASLYRATRFDVREHDHVCCGPISGL